MSSMNPARAPRTDAKDARAIPAEAAAPRVVQSDTLFAGHAQLAIVHERTVYFLRKTRLGKLILTK
jgi:hemin uptake protein HemP